MVGHVVEDPDEVGVLDRVTAGAHELVVQLVFLDFSARDESGSVVADDL